jgi:hypothetical protein
VCAIHFSRFDFHFTVCVWSKELVLQFLFQLLGLESHRRRSLVAIGVDLGPKLFEFVADFLNPLFSSRPGLRILVSIYHFSQSNICSPCVSVSARPDSSWASISSSRVESFASGFSLLCQVLAFPARALRFMLPDFSVCRTRSTRSSFLLPLPPFCSALDFHSPLSHRPDSFFARSLHFGSRVTCYGA